MPTALGIDVGTTRTKALVLDTDPAAAGAVLAVAAAPTPQRTAAGVALHRPADVRSTALAVAATALDRAGPVAREGLSGIAVTSVGEEAVLLDADGAPVGDVPTWFSGVGVPYAHSYAAELAEQAPVAGLRHPEYTVHALAWWAQQRPDQARAALTLTDLGSWLLSSLGSGGVGNLVMDHSHASRTGMFDAPTRSWHPAALDVVGTGHLALPRLVPSGTVVGGLGAQAAAALGVTAGLPLVAGGHDHFCAALASGARAPGDLFISAGTSEAHLLLTDTLDPASTAEREVGCFVSGDLFYLHAALPSGSAFATLTRVLGIDPQQPLDDVLRAEPIGSRGAAATMDADRRVSLTHLPTDAGPATAMRALMEATAVASWRLTSELGRTAGRSVGRRLIAGAPTASSAWREMRTELGDAPAVFVDAPEATALGAAHLAARAITGELPPPAAARPADPPVAPERRRLYSAIPR